MKSFKPTRRAIMLAGISIPLSRSMTPTLAQPALPVIVLNKSPDCTCCQRWADHLVAAGFGVQVKTSANLAEVRKELGVPTDLASCHTAQVNGYILEGHVPADAVVRLLQERPRASGLAVPGMPAGSPGMEANTPEIYDVVLFGPNGRSVYDRYHGLSRL
jgi:hypothetical protein